MVTVNQQFNDFNKAAIDAAISFTSKSIGNAERLFALNFEAARLSIDEASKNVSALSSVKDAQEFNAVGTEIAQTSYEHAQAYSRTYYDLAAGAQAEYASIVEERIAEFQKELVSGLDKVAKTAPAGSDVVIAALKSNLAATNAVLDNMTKAAKQASTLADNAFVKTTTKAAPVKSGKRK